MTRPRDRRTRIIAWIISLLIVLSMALSLAGAFLAPRRGTPAPEPSPTAYSIQMPIL